MLRSIDDSHDSSHHAPVISLQQLGKSYGERAILTDLSLHIPTGSRIGVVGPNGAGKTTLFGILTGEIPPDAGRVEISGGYRLAYLRQVLQGSLLGGDLLGHVESGRPDLMDLHAQLESLSARLTSGDPALLTQLGELEAAYETRGGYRLRHRAQAALCGLGFKMEEMALPLASFSGGWQMRAELARVLVSEPDALMLDEPTNYLDIPAVEWLQKFLSTYTGTLLLVSHDRFLLNALTTETLEVVGGRGTRYPGNYDAYVQARDMRQLQDQAAAERQQKERERTMEFVDRFRAKSTKAAQVQSRIKKLEKMETVSVRKITKSRMRFSLREPARSGEEVLRLENVGLTYDGERWIFRGVDLSIERGERVALVGMNGMGKSSLLRILAGELPANEGQRLPGHNVQVGYQSQEFSHLLDRTATVWETVRRVSSRITDQEVRGILGAMGFSGDEVEKSVSVLSGGETIRLLFARVLADPPNFLVLDEPTTHLDIPSRQTLEAALAEFKGTLCIVSHDIEFVRGVATRIVAMAPPGIQIYSGGYDYYCTKRDEAAKATPLSATRLSSGAAPPAGKQERRDQAEKRQQEIRERRKIEKDIAVAELRIGALESEQGQLAARFGAADPGMDYAVTSQRLQDIQKELSATITEWERLASRLEWLEKSGENSG